MPRNGFTSMTITEQLHDDLKSIYEKNQLKYARSGINSLSGFYTYMAYEGLKANKLLPKDVGVDD